MNLLLLAHGFLGVQRLSGVDYFNGVAGFLREAFPRLVCWPSDSSLYYLLPHGSPVHAEWPAKHVAGQNPTGPSFAATWEVFANAMLAAFGWRSKRLLALD
jgi:hypothetical protein